VTAVDRARRNPAASVARAVSPAAAGLGRLLGKPIAAVARWRGGKPMHPRGIVREAVLERTGSSPSWGVPWLDEPGRHPAVVRLSRGAGLPPPLPDLLGLAVRLPGHDGERVELLFSTTGRGRLSRLVPVLRRHPATAYCSIMGYRTDAGTLRLAAVGERTADGNGDGLVFVLAAARGTGPWRPFARLTLGASQEPSDPDVRFDAVLHPPPGMVPDGPMARLRAPAYAMARTGRDSGRDSSHDGVARD
jgi:hypothetical protein